MVAVLDVVVFFLAALAHILVCLLQLILYILSLQTAALMLFFTKLRIISNGISLCLNRRKCVHDHVLIT